MRIGGPLRDPCPGGAFNGPPTLGFSRPPAELWCPSNSDGRPELAGGGGSAVRPHGFPSATKRCLLLASFPPPDSTALRLPLRSVRTAPLARRAGGEAIGAAAMAPTVFPPAAVLRLCAS